MKTSEDLRQLLNKIDHRGYPAYKETKGSYQFGKYILTIEHVQGDPFAAPSSLNIRIPGRIAGYPSDLYQKKSRRIALQDYLIRKFYRETEHYSFQAKGSGKSGLIAVTRCGQEVLERSACTICESNGDVIIRFEVGFPANGRTINARELIKVLYDFLPSCVEHSLYYKKQNDANIRRTVDLAEDYEYIQSHLKPMGLIAFVANHSILPRESGVSDRPMKEAVPFISPNSLEVSINLPHHGQITGMGIKKGVTLIVGGGYHGKSTLLKAVEAGVYPHIAGDGREYIVTIPDAMKIRAEDGRCIHHTDISMFINDLPNGKDTTIFNTEDASGSTSQAANIIESMEAGTSAFLIDEDTSATNFMVRDELMQRVIHRDKEPITPFIERVRDIYTSFDISTILVAGSSGAYFQVADTIIQMDQYHPVNITTAAKEIAGEYPGIILPENKPENPSYVRKIRPNKNLRIKGRIKLKTLGTDGISVAHETIDLRYVEQLMDAEQLTALSYIVRHLEEHVFDGKITLREAIESLYIQLEKKSFAAITEGSNIPGNLALPRKQEIYACLNRYRKLGVV